jgi:hypothetical protein
VRSSHLSATILASLLALLAVPASAQAPAIGATDIGGAVRSAPFARGDRSLSRVLAGCGDEIVSY